MRIDVAVEKLETGGVLGQWQSSIETNRKTFRMNIDDIYSDKIGSIVREITANAWDSHKRAGQTSPFFVHCPTYLKPEFFVRDYGVGMTQEIMEKVYIILGKSDKDQSDDEVGMWGLGSKSPFAYGDQYEISCYDGVEVRHYGFGISDEGFPTLYLMNVEPCDEPCGVRVGFSVAASDFPLFEAAIVHASIAHDGAFESNIPLKGIGEVAYQGADWNCYIDTPLNPNGYTNVWYARQGCVLYAISAQQVTLPTDYGNGKRSQAYVIDCPIGTVRMTPSREAIQYDPEVVAYLKERVAQVITELEQSVWEAVRDIKSVTDFFDTITRIKPSFVDGKFTHPATGLTEAVVKNTWPGVFFEAALNHTGRWEFKVVPSIALKDFRREIIVVDDIKPLLDPSRDTTEDPQTNQWLSKSEVRRISRFTRAYLEKVERKNIMFFMNLAWSEEFWEACFPLVKVEKINFETLRESVPRRVVPPKEASLPPIKGLALAKSAGEQKPVFEVQAPTADEPLTVAWVSSEQYRRQATALFKVGRRFNLTALYIAAPQAQHHLTGIPHLRDYITTAMGPEAFDDWYHARDKLSHYSVKPYLGYLSKLLKEAPEAYDVLAEAPGEFSAIAKAAKRLLLSPLPDLNDDEKKAIDTIIEGDGTATITTPKDVETLSKLITALSNQHYYNPTCKFATNLDNVKTTERLIAASEALVYLQALIPPTDKYS